MTLSHAYRFLNESGESNLYDLLSLLITNEGYEVKNNQMTVIGRKNAIDERL